VINQKYSIRRLVTFFSSLILFFALLFALFFQVAHAGAAEERYPKIIESATSSKYSSATGHTYTVGSVRAANDGISADISQRVVVDGSSATVKQKVHIPANDPFYKNAGKYAGKLFRGGLAGAALGVAVDAAVDGAGWVIDEGGKVQKKVKPEELAEYNKKNLPKFWSVDFDNAAVWSSTQEGACEIAGKLLPAYKGVGPGCTFPSGTRVAVNQYNNFNYSPDGSTKPVDRAVTNAELDDAFTNWFKNNPNSVTDPVRTYIYSPKDQKGNAIPNSVVGTEPSFGQQEITDEMMQNYIANRDAALVKGNTAVIEDSASTSTETNPDGSKTETSTETNPDGTKTKTETKTEVKTNPETGEVVTTTTTTTTKPDGSTSIKTETSTQTKPNPETSKLPAACEYLAFLCEWTNWTKEKPELEDKQLEIEDIKVVDYKRENHVSFGSSCPFTPQMQSLPMGILGSLDFETDLTFICDFGHDAKPYVLGLGHLGALIFLLLGLRASGA
jgi:hypothetical protein